MKPGTKPKAATLPRLLRSEAVSLAALQRQAKRGPLNERDAYRLAELQRKANP